MESWLFQGKVIDFYSMTGEVIDTSKFSETHVSSSGGGGTVHRGSGYIAAPTIHSAITTNHEFWIRKHDGTEKSITLKGFNIPLRIGQRITLIGAGSRRGDGWWYVALWNHNAGKRWNIFEARTLLENMKIQRSWGSRLFLPLGAFLFILVGGGLLQDAHQRGVCRRLASSACPYLDPYAEKSYTPFWWALVIAIGVLIAITVFKSRKQSMLEESLSIHIDRLLKEVSDNN